MDLSHIREAGSARKILNITYQDSKGNVTSRDTEPYEIKGGKYFGYCLDSQSIRSFSTDRIIGTRITDRDYIPRWPIKL